MIEMLKMTEPPSTGPQPPDPSTAIDDDTGLIKMLYHVIMYLQFLLC